NRLLAAGADSVKMECSSHLADTVRRMAEAAIPVMAHIGLRPQSVPPHEWRVQGRDEAAARQLIEDAKALEDAGAFAVLLEVVTAPLAAQITEALSVPTIGIGAGAGCDGQVLVWHDLLGLHSARPRHAKRYAELGETIVDALNHYAADVRSGAFPGP